PFPKVVPDNDVPALPAEAPASQPLPVSAAVAEPAAKKKRSARSVVMPIIGLALLAGAGWFGYDYWTDGRFMISTDDAYVHVDMAFVSPKITGYVASIPVVENQAVKAGDPLVVVDDGDYRIALDQAGAAIASQHKTLERITAQIEAGKAALQQAEAE